MKKIRILTIIAISLLTTIQVLPQAGMLDITFDGDGIALYDPGDLHDNGYDIVTLPDNSMIILGFMQPDGFNTYAGVLMKLNEDGSIDTSFGEDGLVEIQFGTGTIAYKMEQLDDGKLLVSGLVYINESGDGEFFVAKYNLDGTLDINFNEVGYSLTDYGPDEEIPQAMAIQQDGKIVLAGRTYSGNFSQLLFTRFNPDGTLDTSFGTNGYTEINASSQDEQINSVDILSNGTIVGVGYGYTTSPVWGEQVYLAKLHTNGDPMSSFGNNGVVIPEIFDDVSIAWDIDIENDSLLITGYIYNSSNELEFFLAKLDSSAVAVNNFANDGMARLNFDYMNIGMDILRTADGKIYVSGTTGEGGPANRQFLLTRYLADGSLDPTFNDDGYVITNIRSDWDEAMALAMQYDGKLVLTGFSGGLTNSGDNKLPVVRYLNDFIPVVSNFTASETEFCVGNTVDFTDLSTPNVISWEWTFEGGTPATSTDQNPTVTYNTAGIFDVELTVTDGINSHTITKNNYITSLAIPDQAAMPVGDDMVCAYETTMYTSAGAEFAETYDWNFSPATAGTFTANGLQATVVWNPNFSGTAFISLSGSNMCGDGEISEVLIVEVMATPEPDVSGEDLVCENQTEEYAVNNTQGSTYTWIVSGGDIIAGQGTNMITVTWGTPGNGSVRVTEESEAGCIGNSEVFEVMIDDCTGLFENNDSKGITLYPNPASNTLNIRFDDVQGTDVRIKIFDALGKLIMNENINNGTTGSEHRIDISSFNEGIYFMQIQTNGASLSKQFIKQ